MPCMMCEVIGFLIRGGLEIVWVFCIPFSTCWRRGVSCWLKIVCCPVATWILRMAER